MGLCYLYLKNYDKAEESFIKANVIQRHDSIYMQLGKLYTLQVPPGGDPGPTQRVGSENIPLFSNIVSVFIFVWSGFHFMCFLNYDKAQFVGTRTQYR